MLTKTPPSDTAEALFNAIAALGQGSHGFLHIHDLTATMTLQGQAEHGETVFRCYHAEGFCFQVAKCIFSIDMKTGKPEKFYCFIKNNFEGFRFLGVDNLLKLVQQGSL